MCAMVLRDALSAAMDSTCTTTVASPIAQKDIMPMLEFASIVRQIVMCALVVQDALSAAMDSTCTMIVASVLLGTLAMVPQDAKISTNVRSTQPYADHVQTVRIVQDLICAPVGKVLKAIIVQISTNAQQEPTIVVSAQIAQIPTEVTIAHAM